MGGIMARKKRAARAGTIKFSRPSTCILSFDNPRDHHVVKRTNGFWILVHTASKCGDILSQVRQKYYFIHKAPSCAVYGPGFFIIFLG